jgi:hypothetical protein
VVKLKTEGLPANVVMEYSTRVNNELHEKFGHMFHTLVITDGVELSVIEKVESDK